MSSSSSPAFSKEHSPAYSPFPGLSATPRGRVDTGRDQICSQVAIQVYKQNLFLLERDQDRKIEKARKGSVRALEAQ